MLHKPREPSVRGIMYSSFTIGLTIALLKMNGITFIRLILLSDAIISFILQYLLTNYINEVIKKQRYGNLIVPLILLLLPYGVPFLIGDPRLILELLVIKATLFTAIIIPYRLSPNNMFSYLIGTTLITTVYLDPPAFTGIATYEVFLIWILVATYFTATSYYIESRLGFREVSPLKPLLSWIWVIPTIFILYGNPFILFSTVEPTIKFIRNIVRNEKVIKASDIVSMGRMEMKRGYLFTLLIIISILLGELTKLNNALLKL